jgi:hypothetical protein
VSQGETSQFQSALRERRAPSPGEMPIASLRTSPSERWQLQPALTCEHIRGPMELESTFFAAHFRGRTRKFDSNSSSFALCPVFRRSMARTKSC